MSASTPFNSVAIQCASLCFVNPDEVELILSSIFLDQLETHLDIISPGSEYRGKPQLLCIVGFQFLLSWSGSSKNTGICQARNSKKL